MRPLSLEMTAFGSYAAKTVVPFEQMKHGLYLVTGDTGAGKTTIFDAIVFALFGAASGPDRKGDMLHCDYVPKSEDTVVTLRFLQSGKEFTVTRSLHFRKKRGTDEYGDSTVDAELHEPDCAPIKGASAVTRRVSPWLPKRRLICIRKGPVRLASFPESIFCQRASSSFEAAPSGAMVGWRTQAHSASAKRQRKSPAFFITETSFFARHRHLPV